MTSIEPLRLTCRTAGVFDPTRVKNQCCRITHQSVIHHLDPPDPTCHSQQCDPATSGGDNALVVFRFAEQSGAMLQCLCSGRRSRSSRTGSRTGSGRLLQFVGCWQTAASFLHVREKRGRGIEGKSSRSSLRHASIALTHPTYPYLSSAAPPPSPPPPQPSAPPLQGSDDESYVSDVSDNISEDNASVTDNVSRQSRSRLGSHQPSA